MVPRDPTRQDCGLVSEVGVEVGVVETGLRCVQRRIGQIDTARLDQDGGVDTGDLLGEEPELSPLRYLVTSRDGRGSRGRARGAGERAP